jgi:sterol 3beta-glucosyltransferase
MRAGRIVPGANVTYEPPGSLENLAKHAPRLARHGGALLELVALSEALVDPEGRWGAPYRFTGFWRAPWQGAWSPPAELEAFLANGPPPVVVTMGSMVMFDADRLLGAVVQALGSAGARAIVIGGWSELPAADRVPDFVHCVKEAPYDWLLPRASCVLHHGGCGTVSAVLRAGKPSILMPQISSQRHFAAILVREGLVAGVLDAAAPNADALAGALDRVAGDPTLAASAKRWQAAVRDDPGVSAAADAIEDHWAGLVSGRARANGEG